MKSDNDGSVADPFCIDEDKEVAKIIKAKGKKHLVFVDIIAACNRSMAVTKKGEMYCWGNNNQHSMVCGSLIIHTHSIPFPLSSSLSVSCSVMVP